MGYFEFVVGLLFVLALIDLSVGVSNDAVNFLNSAIGSRVTSRKVILIIAGLGVLVGSMFSSGIMEVARRGIFNPDMFTFADVMIIFLAVMLADVLLLDLFNTFGLPTSTTVSIVFELLGASIATAIFVVVANPNGTAVLDYVNASRAAVIIGGIGLSVFVAFVVGTAVQFFSRMLFTFEKKNHTALIRIAWSAIAFTVLSYFLIIKGLKGASFVSPDTYEYIYSNTLYISLVALAVWGVVMWTLNRLGIDVLALVVLGGTFSLALAFASNDLVNFIGVPLAGFSSWQAWVGTGIAPEQMTMEVLKEPVQGNTLILVGAGAVMVATLWFSSKARSVTKTEVDLGRQDDGAERFRPGPVSRGIVRTFITTGEAAMQAVPKPWRIGIADRFVREKARTFDLERPAFDTLRASVNLTVASILIVFATSLKLPLSTTFVSFMVAMGTSLADQAWGRDSAVYRVAGVFSVIGGWLLTALAAFLMAAIFATLIKLAGAPAIVLLVFAAAFALVRTHRYHTKRSQMEQLMIVSSPDKMDKDALTLRQHFMTSLQNNAKVLDNVLRILVKRKRKAAKKLRKALDADIVATRETENEFVRRLNRIQPKIEPWLMNQLDVLSCERDLLQSASTLADLAGEHVLNEHEPPSPAVAGKLGHLRDLFRNAFSDVAGEVLAPEDRVSSSPIQDIATELDALTALVLEELYSGERSTQNTSIMLGIVLEMRDLHRELQRASAW
ncbi:MAG: inorganic phosphate transporter [Woeseiaceae bacterium]|nr:inorganic phosphate transporter [Woeseiaceae bacterium]